MPVSHYNCTLGYRPSPNLAMETSVLIPAAYHVATRLLQRRVLLHNREKRDSIQSAPDGFDDTLVTVISLNSS